jgi:hypothetical protein
MTHHKLLAFALIALFAMALIGRADAESTGRPPLRWWKGNVHTHSFWSDGDEFPEIVAGWYKDHGYDFLGFSDHCAIQQGEKWVDAAKIPAPVLARYRARFGAGWFE